MDRQIAERVRGLQEHLQLLSGRMSKCQCLGVEPGIPELVTFYSDALCEELSGLAAEDWPRGTGDPYRAVPEELGPDQEQAMFCSETGKVLVQRNNGNGEFFLGVSTGRDPERWSGVTIPLTERQRASLADFLLGKC